MKGHEMKAIRKRLGLSAIQLGRAFGYTGTAGTTAVMIRKYESDARPIPIYLERLLHMFEEHGIPDEYIDERPFKLEALRKQIKEATSIVGMFPEINEFAALARDLKSEDFDIDDEPELPDFDTNPAVDDIDWSEWDGSGQEGVTADETHVLFRNVGEKDEYSYREIAEIIEDDSAS